MKVLTEKANKAIQSRRFKKAAQKVYLSATEIYWHEMEKPREERDEALMSECLETIKQSSAIAFGGMRREHSLPVRKLRWAVAVCMAIIVLAAVSTGVGYAFGVNIWSFMFNGSNRGIVIDGKIEDGHSLIDFDSVSNTNGEEEYNTFDEAKARLAINPLDLDLTKDGFMIDNIYVVKDDVKMELSVHYVSDDDYADYIIQIWNGNANTAFTTEILGEYDEEYSFSANNIEVHVVTADNESAFSWADGEYVYILITSTDAKHIQGVVEAGLNGG